MLRARERVVAGGDDARMPPVTLRFLSQDDVVAAGGTDMPALVDVLEEAFRLKARGEVICPPKVMLTWSDEPDTQETLKALVAKLRK